MSPSFRALVWKEWQENIRWLPVGLIAVSVCIWYAYPGQNNLDNFLAQLLTSQFTTVMPMLAFALGIVQSYRDLQSGPRAYVQHRLITPKQLFLAKEFAGFAIYSIAISTPLLLLAIYILWTGLRWHPVRPAQIVPSIVLALAAFPFHSTAMLMLARPALWWGTKVLPVFAVAGFYFIIATWLPRGGLFASAWSLWIALVFGGMYLVAAYQGWRDLSSDPSGNEMAHSPKQHRALHSVLILSSLVALFALLAVLFAVCSTIDSSFDTGNYAANIIAIDVESGEPWLIQQGKDWDWQLEFTENAKKGARIVEGAAIDPDIAIRPSSRFRRLTHLSTFRSDVGVGVGDGFFSRAFVDRNRFQSVSDRRGYLLCYTDERRSNRLQLTHVVAADGVYQGNQIRGQAFKSAVGVNSAILSAELRDLGYSSMLFDKSGVYEFHLSDNQVAKIIDAPIDNAAVTLMGNERLIRMTLIHGSEISVYGFKDTESPNDWLKGLSEDPLVKQLPRRNAPEKSFRVELIRKYQMPEKLRGIESLEMAICNDGVLLVAPPTYLFNQIRNICVFRISNDEKLTEINCRVSKGSGGNTRQQNANLLAGSLIPLAVLLVLPVIAICDATVSGDLSLRIEQMFQMLPAPAISFLFLLLLCGVIFFVSVLVGKVARARGLTLRQQRFWAWSSLILGLAAPLAMIAIYPRVGREPCPACGKPRRIDLSNCEDCQAAWQTPELTGIEIMDGQAKLTASLTQV